MNYRELVHINAYLPVKLAELSYFNENDALRILRSWEGNTNKNLKQLWIETAELLGEDPTIHIPENKSEVKRIRIDGVLYEEVRGDKEGIPGEQPVLRKVPKWPLMFKADLVKMNAYLPDELTELSHLNESAAVIILREWGEGKKSIRKLWASVMVELEKAKSKKQKAKRI